MGKTIILMITVLLSSISMAQTISVSGTVTDKDTGEPIPAVTVLIKNTLNGTETDFDGNYTLTKLKTGDVLVFSSIGYLSKEKTINQSLLNVQLEASQEALDEIVVVGYGTKRKKELTGAVSIISSESIEALKPVRIEQALQGQVAGVQITGQSGSPGAESNIRIRGISTNGNNKPLILVDGNRIEDLSVINPSDIESVNVLKDATAGIYGVQAANGVILITTKRGRKNSDFNFSFNTYTGLQETSRKIPVLNATEYALLANEAYAVNGQALPFDNVQNLGVGTNWQDEVFKTAVISSTDFSVSKGTEYGAYSFSTSYLDQDGIVGRGKSNFNRLTARLNIKQSFFRDKLNVFAGILYTNTNRSTLIENAVGSVLFNALNFGPNLPVYDSEGNLTLTPAGVGFGQEIINPLAQVENTFNRTKVHKIAPTFRLSYEVLNGLKAEGRFQYNYSSVENNTYRPIQFYNEAGPDQTVFDSAVNTFQEDRKDYEDYIFDAFLTYENEIAEDHKIKALVGTSVSKEIIKNKFDRLYSGMPTASLETPNTNTASTFADNLSANNTAAVVDGARLLSYFTRLEYNYNDRILLSLLARRDGSSKFGPNNKFGFFPSASLGLVLVDNNDYGHFFKLRGSYGIIGNDRIKEFAYEGLLNGEGSYVFNEEVVNGLAIGELPNPDVRWEKQKTLDIGFDATLFDQLDVTFDYFNRKTEDLLLAPQVSGILGSGGPGGASPVINAGTIRNSGFEFSVSYKDQLNDDFKYNLSYNITVLNNNVERVNGLGDYEAGGDFGVGGTGDYARMQAGFPIGYYHGYKTDGVFQNQEEIDTYPTLPGTVPGDFKFVDTNDDGIINDEDRTYIGDPIPDFNIGFNLSFNYKNIDFGTYVFASLGREIVRNYERNVTLANKQKFYLDRWRGEGTSNSVPRVTTGANNNTLFSDFYVEDGSFLRLQNMQVGYTIDSELLEKFKLNKLRLYLSANNLFTLTNYKGYDPTVSNGEPLGDGFDIGFYPVPRMYLLGLNVNF